jgi:uncharacterized protein YkwD
MKTGLLCFFFLCIGMLSFASCSKKLADPGPQAGASEALNKTVLLKLVNEARKKGCQCGDTFYPSTGPLTWNDQLERAAADHSSDMYSKKYFSHVAPDGSKAAERIERAGYHWLTYGENIGMGFKSEEEVISGWLKSPGHCKNILNKEYKEMGVGRAGTYWTQTFGSKYSK